MSCRGSERIAEAERWRMVGERLRKRSRRRFAFLIEMLAASVVDEDAEDGPDIDSVYPYH
jgi:hypothetical protein